MRKKGDLSDFVVTYLSWESLSISGSADLLEFSHFPENKNKYPVSSSLLVKILS